MAGPATHLETGSPRAESSLGLTATGCRASSSGSAAASCGRQSATATSNASPAWPGTAYHTCRHYVGDDREQ